MDEESLAAVTEAAGGSSAALAAAAARAREAPGSCAVVLVEGMSDQAALETLAARRGRNLRDEGVFIVPMGGATNIGHFLGLFGPRGFGVRLAGLCDEGEERDFRRSLEQAGLGSGLDRAGLARLGFFVCVADLEDELIRSLGVRRVEQLIEAQGELGPFRTFTRQPAQRNRTREQQLRRSWAPVRAGRSTTATCLPLRSSSPGCPARWTACCPACELPPAPAPCPEVSASAVFPAWPHARTIRGPGHTRRRLMTWSWSGVIRPRSSCRRMSHFAGQLPVHSHLSHRSK